jgi:PsbP
MTGPRAGFGALRTTTCPRVHSHSVSNGAHMAIHFSRQLGRLRPRLIGAGLLSAALVCCVAACSSSPSQATKVTHGQGVPAGYSEFQDKARGYSLSLPSSWTQINVQSPGAAAIFNSAVKRDPKFAAEFGDNLAAMAKENMSLLAIGQSGENANMVVTTASGTATSSQLASVYPSLASSYERAGMNVVGHQLIHIDGYPALRVLVSLTISGSELPETQFVLEVHSRAYVLTVTKTPAATTSKIASTLRFE